MASNIPYACKVIPKSMLQKSEQKEKVCCFSLCLNEVDTWSPYRI